VGPVASLLILLCDSLLLLIPYHRCAAFGLTFVILSIFELVQVTLLLTPLAMRGWIAAAAAAIDNVFVLIPA
jgi:hypothetical protein